MLVLVFSFQDINKVRYLSNHWKSPIEEVENKFEDSVLKSLSSPNKLGISILA